MPIPVQKSWSGWGPGTNLTNGRISVQISKILYRSYRYESYRSCWHAFCRRRVLKISAWEISQKCSGRRIVIDPSDMTSPILHKVQGLPRPPSSSPPCISPSSLRCLSSSISLQCLLLCRRHAGRSCARDVGTRWARTDSKTSASCNEEEPTACLFRFYSCFICRQTTHGDLEG